jgi:hypothetical protein
LKFDEVEALAASVVAQQRQRGDGAQAELGLGGGTLDRAGRAEILALALALNTLRAPQEVSVPGHVGQE